MLAVHVHEVKDWDRLVPEMQLKSRAESYDHSLLIDGEARFGAHSLMTVGEARFGAHSLMIVGVAC